MLSNTLGILVRVRNSDQLIPIPLAPTANVSGIVADVVNPRAVIPGSWLFGEAQELSLESLKSLIRQRAIEKPENDMQLKIQGSESESDAIRAVRPILENGSIDLYIEQV